MINLYAYPAFQQRRVIIWYKSRDHHREFCLGVREAVEQFGTNFQLGTTHISVCEYYVPNNTNDMAICDNAYRNMQCEFWSPNGEARELIASLGLSHTSFYVGDIIQIDGRFYSSDGIKFEEITDLVSFIPDHAKSPKRF